jgi:plasmid stability protein
MAQILIRQLDDDLKERLQLRARKHGRSTEEEVREILRNAVRDDDQSPMGLGSRIAARFSEVGLDEPVREFRGYPARPATFDE